MVGAKRISYKITVVSHTVLAHCLGEELSPKIYLKISSMEERLRHLDFGADANP